MLNEQNQEKSIEFVSCFLKKIFDVLNASIFDNEIQNLEFISKIEKNFNLFFKVTSSNNFLLFGPNVLNLSPIEVLISCFHEMIHALNHKKGLKDVGTNSYHNKLFLEESLNRGLFVIKHRNHGWSLISCYYPRNVVNHKFVRVPNQNKLLNTLEVFDFLVKNYYWKDFYSHKSIFNPKKDYTFKYTCLCPPPFNSVRSGRGPNSLNSPKIKCMICEHEFICKDGYLG